MNEPGWAAVVDARGVSRSFGSQTVLTEVDLVVHPGEIRGLLGPNGAGKTTLLRIIAGLVDPSAGSVSILDHTWARDRRWLQRRIGLVPAGERSFYLRLTGLENLVFFTRLQGLSLRAARREAHRLLEVVGLTSSAGKRVGLYSHGMQRRLALARALIGDPPLLILDEVTSGLDPEATFDAKQGTRAAADGGTAVLWATQRIEELRGLADMVTLLHEGVVRFDGSVPELMMHASGMVYTLESRAVDGIDLAKLNEAIAGMGSLRPSRTPTAMELLLEDGAPLGEAIVRLEGAGLAIQACRESRDSLEMAFVRIVRPKP